MLTNLKRILITRMSAPENIGQLYTCNEYRWINDKGNGNIDTNLTAESDVIEYIIIKTQQYGGYAAPTSVEKSYLEKYL